MIGDLYWCKKWINKSFIRRRSVKKSGVSFTRQDWCTSNIALHTEQGQSVGYTIATLFAISCIGNMGCVLGKAYPFGHLVLSRFGTCLWSNCWDQASRICRVFYRLFACHRISLDTFSILLYTFYTYSRPEERGTLFWQLSFLLLRSTELCMQIREYTKSHIRVFAFTGFVTLQWLFLSYLKDVSRVTLYSALYVA